MYGKRRSPDRHSCVHARPTKIGTNRRFYTAAYTSEKEPPRAVRLFFPPSLFHNFISKENKSIKKNSDVLVNASENDDAVVVYFLANGVAAHDA